DALMPVVVRPGHARVVALVFVPVPAPCCAPVRQRPAPTAVHPRDLLRLGLGVVVHVKPPALEGARRLRSLTDVVRNLVHQRVRTPRDRVERLADLHVFPVARLTAAARLSENLLAERFELVLGPAR